METPDYSGDRMKDISRLDITRLVDELLTELHLDCSQRVDESIYPHTVKKFSELLHGQYASWCWGEIRSVMRMGITGAYGLKSERINFQTLSTWMKRAQSNRSSNYADKSVYEAHQMAGQTVGDFSSISTKWKEFRRWMEGVNLWFLDNISEHNCNMFHAAKRSNSLDDFRQMLATEPDPDYFEEMKRMTLEQFKLQHESEQVFG